MNTQPDLPAFVDYICKRCQKDKGFAARLRRADDPATEYLCWDVLATFGVNLTVAGTRLSFSLIAAAIARSGAPHNGTLPLGLAIACVFRDGRYGGRARLRLRQLLACEDTEEVCRILQPLLRFIHSQLPHPLDYVALLEELYGFHLAPQHIKARWAQQFYGKSIKEEQP